MKKKLVYFLVFIFVLATFSACSSVTNYGFDITESMVYVQSEDSIISISVEEFDKKTYNEKELEKEIKAEVKEYNELSSDNKGMSFVNLDITKSKATLELEFKSDDDYIAYQTKYVYYGSPIIMLTGTIDKLVKENIPFEGEFKKIDESKTAVATLEELKDIEGLKVLVTNENVKIRVKGNILYTSTNVSLKDGLATTTLGEYNYIFYK